MNTAHAKIVAIPSEQTMGQLLVEALAEFALFTVGPTAGLADEVVRLDPDLILLDVELPAQDGYSICKQLHAHRRTRDIPIAYVARTTGEVTAFGADTDGVLALDDRSALTRHVSRLIVEHRIESRLRQAYAQWEPRQSNELTVRELSVLASGGFALETAPPPKPVVDTVNEYQALLDAGLDVSTAAQLLEVTEGRIRQRLSAKRPELYGIRGGKAWILPAFQFTSEGLVPHLDQVLARLPPGLNPVAVARFFTLPNAELTLNGEPLSPITWLSRGENWEVVAELAEDAGGYA